MSPPREAHAHIAVRAVDSRRNALCAELLGGLAGVVQPDRARNPPVTLKPATLLPL